MNLIKILLVLSFLAALLWAFRNRSRVGLRAGFRIGAVLLTALAIASVVNPGITVDAAHLVGVSRGTDLTLYALIVVFVFTSIGTYFRFREQERRLVEVVRATAIRETVALQGLPGYSVGDAGR